MRKHKHLKRVLILVCLIATGWSFGSTRIKGYESMNTTYKNWDKIDSIFRSFNMDSTHTQVCTFEYKEEAGPHVDMVDPTYEMILGQISKPQTIKLISHYTKACGKSDTTLTIQKMNAFLTGKMYSIELNYKAENSKTSNLVCLVYDEKKYILFSMGVK